MLLQAGASAGADKAKHYNQDLKLPPQFWAKTKTQHNHPALLACCCKQSCLAFTLRFQPVFQHFFSTSCWYCCDVIWLRLALGFAVNQRRNCLCVSCWRWHKVNWQRKCPSVLHLGLLLQSKLDVDVKYIEERRRCEKISEKRMKIWCRWRCDVRNK